MLEGQGWAERESAAGSEGEAVADENATTSQSNSDNERLETDVSSQAEKPLEEREDLREEEEKSESVSEEKSESVSERKTDREEDDKNSSNEQGGSKSATEAVPQKKSRKISFQEPVSISKSEEDGLKSDDGQNDDDRNLINLKNIVYSTCVYLIAYGACILIVSVTIMVGYFLNVSQ
ncbi:uncharacterized protein LOC108626324 [Ceratina calcarata]|uniref:Uncharacterized protein LOC108626324 n=1 Tax=Ceratina calcarata TaxID=156304 RepID=A0AAJ7J267_9HYME|nr:uncharacterized protein LOC108626324 [Ceratina calcarata]